MTSRPPLALVVMPLLTLLSLAFSMLLPPSASRLVYARVWGGPPSGALAVRAQLIEEDSGLSRGVAARPLTLEATSPAGTVVRTVQTGVDGWVDVLLPLPGASDALELEVRGAPLDPQPLARGHIAPSRSAWLARALRAPGVVLPDAHAELPISLRFEPPVLSVPFAAELIATLSSAAPAPVLVRLEISGARLLTTSVLHLAPGKAVSARFEPLEHSGVVALTASTAAGPVRRSVALPIRAGSMTLAAAGDELTILSPVLRARAYFSVVSPAGRLGGGVVSLGPRPDGTAAGRLARGDLPTGADRYLVLSSSPDGRAPALVGLPLDGQTSTFDAREELLLDGRPRADSSQRAARRRLRWALSAYAAVGATLSLILFVWHIRRANERLRLDLAEVGAPAEIRERSLSGPLSALLSLLFAFGLALTWILLR